MKRKAPAAERNREPIAAVLRDELPERGLVLEIASGTGEHALHFAREFPALQWQPSDPDPQARSSIAAWRDAEGPGNLREPLDLDVTARAWLVGRADAIVCINMVHISPRAATESLTIHAGEILDTDQPLILYGPYIEDDRPTAPSNLAFDADLRARNSDWGLRRVEWLDDLANACRLERTRRVEMPANNLMLVYRRRA